MKRAEKRGIKRTVEDLLNCGDVATADRASAVETVDSAVRDGSAIDDNIVTNLETTGGKHISGNTEMDNCSFSHDLHKEISELQKKKKNKDNGGGF